LGGKEIAVEACQNIDNAMEPVDDNGYVQKQLSALHFGFTFDIKG